MAKKPTSKATDLTETALRVLGAADPLEAYRGKIAIALQECGLPLHKRAVDAIADRIGLALAPLLDDLQSLALAYAADRGLSLEAPLELNDEADE